jgi:hypothetical protein
MESNYTVLLTYRLLKNRFKFAFGMAIRDDFLRWQHANNWPNICWLCHKPIQKKYRSLDHLIPTSIALMIGMPELIVDWRNWSIAHIKCNGKRGDDLKVLPDAVRIRVESLILAATQN